MRTRSGRLFWVAGFIVAVGLAVGISPWASSQPDGLERVAYDQGFWDQEAGDPVWSAAPAPDYAVPGIKDESWTTTAAGFMGTVVVFGLAYGLAWGLRKRQVHTIRPDAG